jgi:hypothetical protein
MSMSLRFFRRIRIATGMRANLSRAGVSLSVGRKGSGTQPAREASGRR